MFIINRENLNKHSFIIIRAQKQGNREALELGPLKYYYITIVIILIIVKIMSLLWNSVLINISDAAGFLFRMSLHIFCNTTFQRHYTTFSSFQCFKNCALSVATCSLGLSIFVVVVVVVGELPTHKFFNRPVSVIQTLRCLCS